MDMRDWPYIKKSARRKKRLVKKDFDKKLMQLSRLRHALGDQLQKLPPVILEHPYQRGWMRSFILHADVARSDKAEFYEALLDKINTFCWHHDRSFKKKRMRKGGYKYFDARQQKLREFEDSEFHGNKLNFSEGEKECFYLKEEWSIRLRKWKPNYVFAEPWRFELVIRPHIVYAKRQIDEVLEQEIGEIESHINGYYLQPRIWKLKGGKYKY